jgi:hypothetical protein
VSPDEFRTVLTDRLKNIEDVLGFKGAEYGSDKDQLHNFKVASNFSGGTPEQALWGFLVKHLVSVHDLINEPERATPTVINEKIGDCINYFILLEAIFKERNGSVTQGIDQKSRGLPGQIGDFVVCDPNSGGYLT